MADFLHEGLIGLTTGVAGQLHASSRACLCICCKQSCPKLCEGHQQQLAQAAPAPTPFSALPSTCLGPHTGMPAASLCVHSPTCLSAAVPLSHINTAKARTCHGWLRTHTKPPHRCESSSRNRFGCFSQHPACCSDHQPPWPALHLPTPLEARPNHPDGEQLLS